jgi:predicted nucleic acid binding AN1-type Zn finger protein
MVTAKLNLQLQFTDLPLSKNQTFYLFSCDKKTKQDSDHDLIADINRNGKQQQNNPIKQLGLEIQVKKKNHQRKYKRRGKVGSNLGQVSHVICLLLSSIS